MARLKPQRRRNKIGTQRSTFNLTTGRNERRQAKWARGPHGAFPSAACLGPNPDMLRKKKTGKKEGGKTKDYGREERKQTEKY